MESLARLTACLSFMQLCLNSNDLLSEEVLMGAPSTARELKAPLHREVIIKSV